MNWLKKLFGHQDTSKNVVLLVRVRHPDDTISESRHVVARHLIQNACETACSVEDAVEVWVYQKIFHHTNAASEPEPAQKTVDEPFDVFAAALGTVGH